ncbi:MAG TPA: bifunctional metallophosphatase/5'-nucleotidase [Polyangiaceae bacterium]|nr:bifunctional metallophosphatase/5'-nucleotidase [Polyangiaceae bacterium]
MPTHSGTMRARGSAVLLLAAGCARAPASAPPHAAPAVAAPVFVAPPSPTVRVKILGFNDFHGQLSSVVRDGRPLGGAPVLAAYLGAGLKLAPERTFVVHAGDFVGASPPNSALLQDEPSVAWLNVLTDERCTDARRETECPVIATLGNHEFDEGKSELLRLLRGGNHAAGPFLENPWHGARYDVICANVLDAATGAPLFRPYALRRVDGVPIAFIGAVLRGAPDILSPDAARGLTFTDEADAVNAVVRELTPRGVHAFVVQIHQGDVEPRYEGPTMASAPAPSGALDEIVSRLDDDVDLVVSGHAHRFTNARLRNRNGKELLVVQALSQGVAYDDVDLVLERASGDVIASSATIVPTFADAGPGLAPDPAVAAIVAAADERVAPVVSEVVGFAAADVTREPTPAGESALGDLVAEAARAALHADFGLTNPGGLRANLPAGKLTRGDVLTAQPFGNRLVAVTLSGVELTALLEQQWGAGQPSTGRVLQIAGFGYTWDARAEPGRRVVELHDARHRKLDAKKRYRVAVSSFLVEGGDGFTELRALAPERAAGAAETDADALVAFLKSLPQPFVAKTDGRILKR